MGFCFLYLYHEDLWFSNKVRALVPFEHGRDRLDTDYTFVAINVVIISMTQEGEQKAISI